LVFRISLSLNYRADSRLPRTRKRPRANRADPTDIPALDPTALRIWSPVLTVLSNIAQTARRDDELEDRKESEEPADVLAEALARKCLQISLGPAQYGEETKVDQGESAPLNMDEDFMVIDAGGDKEEQGFTGESEEKEMAAMEERTYRFAIHVWLVALWTNGMDEQPQKRVGGVEMDLGLSASVREDLGRSLGEGVMNQLLSGNSTEAGR
jgi:hypothetical protein